MSKIVPIYLTGRGHYALGSPDGAELNAGASIKVLLAGRRLPGQVHWSPNGDYIQFDDETFCGLYPAMCVVPPLVDKPKGRLRGPYRPRNTWTADRQQHLVDRYLQLALEDPQRRLHSIGCQIAEETGRDRTLVCAKLYQLRSSLAEDLRRRQQLHNRQRLINQLPALVHLQPGGILWIVRQPTKTTAWNLDYPHGMCPVAPGQLCLYEHTLYRTSLVGSSHFSVVNVSPSLLYAQDLLPVREGVSHV